MAIHKPWVEMPGHSPLFSKYLSDSEWRKKWMGLDSFEDDSIQKKIEYLKKKKFDREAIVNILEDQNKIFLNLGAQKSLDKAKLGNCVFVMTGQQPGAFGGPLYNLYKAVSAIQFSKKVEAKSGLPCVPLFWVAGNDYDVDEADSFFILNKDNRLEKIALHFKAGQPLNELSIIDKQRNALAVAREKIAREEYLDLANELYAHGTSDTLSDQFMSFLMKIFGDDGLLVVETNSLKGKSDEALQSILVNQEKIHSLIQKNNEELIQQGYHVQVVSDSASRFLVYEKGSGRKRVEFKQDSLFRDGQQIASSSNWLKKKNFIFTPDALGRPLWQDLIFPVVSYIAGPGEIGYFHQLRDVYKVLNMEMPLILPRLSATIVSSRQRRFLSKLKIVLSDFYKLPEKLNVGQSAETFLNEKKSPEKMFKQLEFKALDEHESALYKKLIQKMNHIESKFYHKLSSYRLNKLDVGAKQLAEVRDILLPGNKLQERVFGAYPFLCQHGSSFVDLIKGLPYQAGEHLIVSMEDNR